MDDDRTAARSVRGSAVKGRSLGRLMLLLFLVLATIAVGERTEAVAERSQAAGSVLAALLRLLRDLVSALRPDLLQFVLGLKCYGLGLLLRVGHHLAGTSGSVGADLLCLLLNLCRRRRVRVCHDDLPIANSCGSCLTLVTGLCVSARSASWMGPGRILRPVVHRGS